MTQTQEIVSPYALTTLARVKDRIGRTASDTSFDALLSRMINSVSQYFENQCGGRQFVQRSYTNEVYSPGSGQAILNLRNYPVISVSSFQYRAGPPSAPSWTSFITDQWELMNPRNIPNSPGDTWYPDGQLRVYGYLPNFYSNAVRISYIGGYAVDWPNAGNSTHQLPGDISDTVENIVVRRFKRRELAGKQSEGLDSANTSWRDSIDSEDQAVIDSYSQVPMY